MHNIDKDKIEHKLLFMQDNLIKLKKLQELDKQQFLKDFRNVDSTKYLLQITIEAMLDIASHLIARNRWGKPENNKEHFEILAQNNVIGEQLVNTYFNMVKFRNRVVHLYFKVDDEMIYKILQDNLEDFEVFIKDIIKILE